jgi:hypothetical protein
VPDSALLVELLRARTQKIDQIKPKATRGLRLAQRAANRPRVLAQQPQ